MVLLLMVMPRSRSMSIESRIWSRKSRFSTAPQLAAARPTSSPPAGAAAPSVALPPNVEVAQTHGGWTQYRLKSNGMTILLVPDHTAPVFTFEVVYHVGSRNESPGNTGSAH